MKKSFSLALLITTSVISGAFGGDPAHPFEPEKATVAPAAKKAVDSMADFADQHSIFFQNQVNRFLTDNKKLSSLNPKESATIESLKGLLQDLRKLQKNRIRTPQKIYTREWEIRNLEKQQKTARESSEAGPDFSQKIGTLHETIEGYQNELKTIEETKKEAIQSMLKIIQHPDLQSKEVSPQFQDAVRSFLRALSAHKDRIEKE